MLSAKTFLTGLLVTACVVVLSIFSEIRTVEDKFDSQVKEFLFEAHNLRNRYDRALNSIVAVLDTHNPLSPVQTSKIVGIYLQSRDITKEFPDLLALVKSVL
jgi:hypothetical protein